MCEVSPARPGVPQIKKYKIGGVKIEGHFLYPHNQNAYLAAVSMMKQAGKAAIIHPTGTGKSFIGFQLCADHSEKRVLWLSPSEYICKTQLENWNRSGGMLLSNITFHTYAKLMLMEAGKIKELQPDFIILDEFHRCGAKGWGEGVKTLLSMYPDAAVLGLSATNIRYLDNQRDMAEEIFEGHIASRMTIGEAVVQGILHPPKYVLSMYSYRKDFEKYQKKIRHARNAEVRKSAEEYFEALRRTLEKADGMDAVFEKHMPDKEGKYIVFCPNAEQMDELIEKVPDWFSGVDPDTHVYRVYSEDPETNASFSAFKKDNSAHLKLLFCIDMLNEGVHVDGISGVILLRPTVSPIVYKQQIGRAMSAGAGREVVIFDIVQNAENLYSISAIEEEMQAAITYYRYTGENSRIVNERFEVVDETRDCKRLFTELEMRLNSSWDLMYEEAKKFYAEHGHLRIPAKYKTENGVFLGNWLNLQRKIFLGKAEGCLTDIQIRRLNELGIVWDSYYDLSWEKNYLQAKEYFDTYGDLDVPARYVTKDGFALGSWISRMRSCKSDQRDNVMTPERIQKLEAIGMTWDALSEQWEKNYLEAADYYKRNGNLLIPGTYVSPTGIKLGNWIAHLRMAKKGTGKIKLSEEQIRRLEMIGMVWDADEERWRIGYENAQNYSRTHGDLKVPAKYKTDDGYTLGLWINLKRRQYKKHSLSQKQIRDLERIGMVWSLRTRKGNAV